jgi:acyl-CoA thioesterase
VTDGPELLRLTPAGDNRWSVHQPALSPEGGNVVFGGQLLAQTIIAADAHAGGAKYIKTMNTVFSRGGVYSEPIEVTVAPFQSGRTFAADVITAWQGERLLVRSLVLLTSDEPDLIAHQLDCPAVTGPEEGEPTRAIVFPDAEARTATLSAERVGGVPASAFWTRMPTSPGSAAAQQAVLAYATSGQLIGLAMSAHPATVRIEDAHRSLSTGVIDHSISFHREFDAAQWLLFVHEATFAGKGRLHGRGAVYREDGVLVATFAQDSMLKPTAPPPRSVL